MIGNRLDFKIYSDGPTFVLTDADWFQHNFDRFDAMMTDLAAEQQGIEQSLLLSFSVERDGGFNGRLVLGDLSPQEAAEWVGQITGKLNLGSGQLLLIVDWTMDYEPMLLQDTGEYLDSNFCYVPVPPGEYQVEILSYLPNYTGLYCLKQVSDEPLGDYCRRTQGNEAVPLWVSYRAEEIIDYRNEATEFDRYIDFIFRLTPLNPDQPITTPELDEFGHLKFSCRQPDRCPSGIQRFS